ncbi:MAG: DUF1080 domain-containing protein, partial [Halieaceae bacterium]|nr:DUF1080 domain-containing protein [Halieaceae bacterium]
VRTRISSSVLTTLQKYNDFILEFDVQMDPALNAAVLFRSQHKDANELSYGYQLKLDGTARAWTGGIYDEERRAWLYNLSRNNEARSAFKPSHWNHIRIEAIGPSIRTWVNGIPAADLIDDTNTEGFIRLHVNSISDNSNVKDSQVRWKNIRIKTDDLSRFKTSENIDVKQFSYLKNQLTQREVREGWQMLWDGKTTKGWRGAKLSGFPRKGWKIDNGILSVLSSGGGEARNGGDIITLQEFTNFELELDFRYTKGANSGIKYFVDPDLLKGKGSAIGLEFQILDDEHHPDAKKGVAGNRTVGSLYDLITAVNLSEPENQRKRINPPGYWNRARIVVKGDYVEHWLNNILVVRYYRGTQIFRALVAYSKYAKWPNFGEWGKGPILLQDHGDLVSFRSIKIRNLSSNERQEYVN